LAAASLASAAGLVLALSLGENLGEGFGEGLSPDDPLLLDVGLSARGSLLGVDLVDDLEPGVSCTAPSAPSLLGVDAAWLWLSLPGDCLSSDSSLGGVLAMRGDLESRCDFGVPLVESRFPLSGAACFGV
jgi:hypothetical protein